MTGRDDNILRHIGRYRVSLRAVIERLYFDRKSCDHVLQRLLEQKRIQSFGGLPEGLSYYQLSLREARIRGVPHDRAEPHSPAQLREALAVLWFCCMGESLLVRAEGKQLALFGPGVGMRKPHCYEKTSDGRTLVYRLYVPGPGTANERLVRKLHGDFTDAVASPDLAPYVRARLYSFAIIVDSRSRAERLTTLLKRYGETAAMVSIAVVPGPSDLALAIRKRRTLER